MATTTPKKMAWLFNNLLVILTIAGVVVGVVIGITVRGAHPSQDALIWIGLLGDVYMRLLKMVILPLIVSSVITGTASLDPKVNGRISMISLAYIVITNSLGCLLPIMLTLAAKPGKHTSNNDIATDPIGTDKGTSSIETIDVFADLIRNLFPPNIVSACFEQAQTKYDHIVTTDNVSIASNATLSGNLTQQVTESTKVTTITKVKFMGTVPSTNILGLVICSFIMGVATSTIGKEGRAFFAFFYSCNAVIMKVLSWIIWMTPVGVASLIAAALLKAEQLDSVIKSLGYFSLIIIGSLLLHLVLLAIFINLVMLRSNPLTFMATLGRTFIVSFATSSSAMAIPESLHTLEKRSHLDSRVTRFVVPLATTINRDGSSIFIGASCVFMAQMNGQDLNPGQVIILWALITFVSMATPSIPSSSIVVISIILSSLGVPTHLVGLLFATEWLLDRLRTIVNVASHCFCALVTNHFCRHSLPPLSKEEPHSPEENTTLITDKGEVLIIEAQQDPSTHL